MFDPKIASEVKQAIQNLKKRAAAGTLPGQSEECPDGFILEEQDLYLLQDSRSFTGNCVVWWVGTGQGYTTDIDEAGRFTKEAAFAQHKSRKTDVPRLLSDMEKLSRRRVDMQLLPKEDNATKDR